MDSPVRLKKFALSLLALLCLLTNCKQHSAPPNLTSRVTFTDDLGKKISVPAAPQRIISLAPSITEILFALDLGERIIGVTTYCDFPAATKTKEKVGDTLKPNLERIIALKPDLVLLSTASQLEKITQQLEQLGIPVFVTNPKTVDAVIASVRKIGEVTGAKQKADVVAAEMQQKIHAIQAQAHGTRPRVLYVLQLSPLITAGKKTFINDLITLAGAQSISGEEMVDYPQFSRETALARAPEVIIIPASHGTEIISITDVKNAFATTPAVKNNRIVTIDPDLIDRPGPRIVEGLTALEAKIHAK